AVLDDFCKRATHDDRIEILHGPSAVSEAAVGVLAGSPWSLYDAVEADEFSDECLHGFSLFCTNTAPVAVCSEVMDRLPPQRSTRLRRRAHAGDPRRGAARRGTPASCSSRRPLRSCPPRPAP